jgi:hypothetical protein
VVEAADDGLLAPEFASEIARIKGVRSHGVRVGELAVASPSTELNTPDVCTKKGSRDRAVFATLLVWGLRRSELAALTMNTSRCETADGASSIWSGSVAGCGRFRCRHRRKMRLTYRRRTRESRKGIFSGRSTYPAAAALPVETRSLTSLYRQRMLASSIWRGVLHSGDSSSGLPTTMQAQRARDVATLKRLRS